MQQNCFDSGESQRNGAVAPENACLSENNVARTFEIIGTKKRKGSEKAGKGEEKERKKKKKERKGEKRE